MHQRIYLSLLVIAVLCLVACGGSSSTSNTRIKPASQVESSSKRNVKYGGYGSNISCSTPFIGRYTI